GPGGVGGAWRPRDWGESGESLEGRTDYYACKSGGAAGCSPCVRRQFIRGPCMKIAFIGFGEAARAFTASLREQSGLSFSTFDILTARGADAGVRRAESELEVTVAPSPAEAVSGADWLFSAVTAADSLDAARSVAGSLSAAQTYIDINSVSAGRKAEAARIVGSGGAAYVDMAVM